MRRPAILAIALLLATATAVQGATFPKVSGTYTYEYLGGTSIVTLDAQANGLGSGTFTFERPGPAVYLEGDVTCVFIHKQQATIFGVVTYAENSSNTMFVAAVYDSGVRGGAGDMAMSFAGPGEPPADCQIPPAWGSTANMMVPITDGDVRIH